MIRKIAIILLCVVLICIAIFSGYQIFSILTEYNAGEEAYEELLQYVSAQPETTPIPTIPVETVPTELTEPGVTEPPLPDVSFPAIDFEALAQINPDVVGWVAVDGTQINYPVVQGEDNRHYASTLFDGHDNGAGSIFMDYRSNADLSDRHTIIYGHNMKNGSMFANICEYKDQAYYEAHPTGIYITPEGNYRIEFFAGYVCSLADNAWQNEFVADDDFEQWLQTTIEHSAFIGSVRPTAEDQVITFSTCTYEFNEARFVLVGILNKIQ